MYADITIFKPGSLMIAIVVHMPSARSDVAVAGAAATAAASIETSVTLQRVDKVQKRLRFKSE